MGTALAMNTFLAAAVGTVLAGTVVAGTLLAGTDLAGTVGGSPRA